MEGNLEQNQDHIGNILRELCEKGGFTREWISAHANLNLRQISAIELWEKNPSVDSLRRLIRYMRVSSDRIFYPELSAKDTVLDDISRQAVTCSPSQRKLILAFIKMLKILADIDLE